MEPDVVLEQGDTCERCYFLHIIPADLAQRLEDGYSSLQSVASEVIEQLQVSDGDELPMTRGA